METDAAITALGPYLVRSELTCYTTKFGLEPLHPNDFDMEDYSLQAPIRTPYGNPNPNPNPDPNPNPN